MKRFLQVLFCYDFIFEIFYNKISFHRSQCQISDKTSQIAKPSDELRHIKEKQASADKDKHLNSVAGAVTNTTGDFELAFLLGEMKYHLASLYSKIGDGGKVWISGKFDKDTGKILSIKFGRIANHNHTKHLDGQ